MASPSRSRLRTLLGDRLTSAGVGTYLGECTDSDDARYRETIETAVALGATLIDSAINYRCQRSERTIGTWCQAHPDAAEQVVVCTKGGYVPLEGTPPASKAAYREYVEREYIETGLIPPDELVAGGHCLAPTFLADQIARSRRNLGGRVIDLYYVHNPEQHRTVLSPSAFTARMTDAFAALERAVADGHIRAYGCATWTGFRGAPDAPDGLQLEALTDIARTVAGDAHHFAAIQLPVNLAMPEAVRLANQTVQGRACTILQAASDLQIDVIVSAPLAHGALVSGLPAQLHELFPRATSDAQRALSFVRTLPGVTSVLVGMRSRAHVEENLAVLLADPEGGEQNGGTQNGGT